MRFVFLQHTVIQRLPPIPSISLGEKVNISMSLFLIHKMDIPILISEVVGRLICEQPKV